MTEQLFQIKDDYKQRDNQVLTCTPELDPGPGKTKQTCFFFCTKGHSGTTGILEKIYRPMSIF